MSENNLLSRKEIFLEASKRLRQDLEKAILLPHQGEKGKEVENALKIFIKEHFPKRFDAVSGFILDNKDQVSQQTDVIIYDMNSCPTLATYDDNVIVPSDNVAAVVEVKSNLTSSDIQDAAEKISRIKSLAKSPISLPEGPWNIETIGILFAFSSKLSIETVLKHYVQSIAKYGFGKHIDYIFILDEGMLSIGAHIPGDKGVAPMIVYKELPLGAPEGTIIVAGGTKYKEKTLDQFMRFLLAHLQFFWPWISHPGFDNSPSDNATGEKVFGTFLTVKLNEKDPIKHAVLTQKYKEKFAKGQLD